MSGSKKSLVYRGDASRFNDRKVRNGVHYKYTITARDQAGNTSIRTIDVTPARGCSRRGQTRRCRARRC